jgi:hypothetical protein
MATERLELLQAVRPLVLRGTPLEAGDRTLDRSSVRHRPPVLRSRLPADGRRPAQLGRRRLTALA